jgi:serine/threonine protein kinase
MVEGQSAAAISSTVYPLGRYIVLAELGRGGMAEVYLALSRGPSGFSKLVVLKLLRAHLAEDDEFLRMFLAEARLAARLNHPNIVQTYEIGVEGGRNCIVMEYLEGCSLAEIDVATRHKPMPLSLSVRIIADTLAGLHHAHERCDVHGQPLSLVHRDVSPHNICVTYDGQVKVLDFGIAKAADDGARTKTGVFKGKLRYTAPERFRGEESDRRSDVFSVGVMLWQVLVKRPLWSGVTDLALMQQLASRVPIQSPRSIDPEVPAALDAICMKAVAMSPDDRFQTAAEMQDALEEFLAAESLGTTNRGLARFMGELFGQKRQQFQRAVDEQLRAAASVPLDLEFSASAARIRAHGVPRLGLEDGTDSLSSLPLPTSSSRMKGSLSAMSPSVNTVDTAPSVLSSEAPPAPARRRFTGLMALATISAALSALLLVYLRTDRPRIPPSEEPAPSAAVVSTGGAVGVVSAAPSASATDQPPEETSSSDTARTMAKRPPGPAPSTGPGHVLSARAVRPVPALPETHVQPAAQDVEPARHAPDCSSPYFIDDQGIKKVRWECL